MRSPRGDAEPLSAFSYDYEWPDWGHPVRRLIRYNGAADPSVKLAASADPQTWPSARRMKTPSCERICPPPVPASGA